MYSVRGARMIEKQQKVKTFVLCIYCILYIQHLYVPVWEWVFPRSVCVNGVCVFRTDLHESKVSHSSEEIGVLCV